jgi:hypothetical protein
MGLKATATIDARCPLESVLDAKGRGQAVNDPWIAQRAA